ncbi:MULTISPECIES: hypothetical protein [unclassified Neochlamydia]|uniref:hypothetical protein n=1 Tax=unclassified Neochlamydia TaxID=2643326 RepID=UPI00140D5DF0|nr:MULTISPECIES: hypothetical protein [unclassified Neochlamydia]MBS4169311.1 Uncharacterized protein [Neochlamydia sp. AcF95]
MRPSKIIDRISLAIAIAALFFSFILFYRETFEAKQSFAAAIMLAALVWLSYIMLRCLLLALKK